MKKTLLFVLTLFQIAGISYAQQTGNFTKQVTDPNSGAARNLYVYVPEDYQASKAYPLICAWHGLGSSGNEWRATMKRVSSKVKAILVCPDYNGITTDDSAAQHALSDLAVKFAFDSYNIDKSKAIITGHSFGGRMSFKWALEFRDKFKGIIGINPAMGSVFMTPGMWANVPDVKAVTILGTADVNYSIVKSFVEDTRNAGSPHLLLEKQGVVHTDFTYFNSAEMQDDFYTAYTYIVGFPSTVSATSLRDKMQIYPNPATSLLNIANLAPAFNTCYVQVIDITGREYATPSRYTGYIDISFLSDGLYFLNISNAEGNSIVLPFIKR